jgi:prepilin-type processing-associated H-X9-DG protein
MKRVRWPEVLLCLLIMAIVGGILMPVQTGRPPAKITVCLSNVKQMAIGTMLYMGDTDDRYPLRDHWMDAQDPYIKRSDVLHCPLVPKGAYGYAFDSRLSGAKPPKDPAKATLIFESVNPIRNASDPLLSLLNPGRHAGTESALKAGRNNFAFADGHAKAYPGGVAP